MERKEIAAGEKEGAPGRGVKKSEKDLRRIEATETVQDSIGVNTHSGRKGGALGRDNKRNEGFSRQVVL